MFEKVIPLNAPYNRIRLSCDQIRCHMDLAVALTLPRLGSEIRTPLLGVRRVLLCKPNKTISVQTGSRSLFLGSRKIIGVLQLLFISATHDGAEAQQQNRAGG